MGLLALTGYSPDTPPEAAELTTAQKNVMKTKIREMLTAHQPLDEFVVVTRIVKLARTQYNKTIYPAQVMEVLDEMRAAGEFAPGYGGLETP